MTAVPQTMKAWQYSKYGGLTKGLEQVEKGVPKPGPEEILLKVHASSVNPVDWKLQTGNFRLFVWLTLPVVPGLDMAGAIVAVGSAATDYKVGDRLVVNTTVTDQGGLGEYVLVKTKKYAVARLPDSISYEDAAGMPTGGLTALQGLIKGGFTLPSWKRRVLVQAASGGVGTYAVQIAKQAGAHVTATASTRNIELVKSLGADEVLDYKKLSDPKNPLQSSSKEPYDIILHCTSKEEPWQFYRKVLAPKGKVLSFTPGPATIATVLWQTVTFSRKRLIPMTVSPNSKDLQTLVGLMADKKLKTVLDSRYPLSEAKKAWEKNIDGHTVGKVIVTVG